MKHVIGEGEDEEDEDEDDSNGEDDSNDEDDENDDEEDDQGVEGGSGKAIHGKSIGKGHGEDTRHNHVLTESDTESRCSTPAHVNDAKSGMQQFKTISVPYVQAIRQQQIELSEGNDGGRLDLRLLNVGGAEC
ncbi:hypothetical protein BGZ52_009892 [Haplosporangium bisporale]|nr:hypothetical protein BGZ52_009892 [Haplosporangium bisporale]